MAKIAIQSVDLLVHPFFELSTAAGCNELSPRQRQSLGRLVSVWARAIKSAKLKEGNLFVLISYPLANPECHKALGQLKQLATKELGPAKFRETPFSLSQVIMERHLPVSLGNPPFNNIRFLNKKPIRINPLGERKGACPITQAGLLQSALLKEGLAVNIARRKNLSGAKGNPVQRKKGKPAISMLRKNRAFRPK